MDKRNANFVLSVVALMALSTSAVFGADSVVASSFGYDSADATDCLQKAIDSGAKRVVVDKQEAPWIVKTIKLRSDLELVLQEGVEILAKEGEFQNKGDVLLLASNVSNVTIRGEGKGATLRMRKKDYWKEPYSKSEWRHGVSLLSSSNVRIENLTIAETGGDGIYLGVATRGVPCRNITIKNVDCVANNRQGISVISVDGLLMEDVLLRDTVGTAPEAGIDFEPNRADEQITNAVMRRVKAINNRGGGFAFYLPNLRENGKELSVKMEDCEAIRNNASGISFTVFNGERGTLPGKIELENVDLVGNFYGAAFRSKWADGAPVEFKNVKIVTPSAAKALRDARISNYDFNVVDDGTFEQWTTTTTDSGLSLIAVGTDTDANGGYSFENFEIVDAREEFNESLVLLRDASSEGVGFKNLTGAIKTTKLDATGAVVSDSTLEPTDENLPKLFPQLAARRVPAVPFETLNAPEGAELAKELSAAWSSAPSAKSVFRARGGAKYAFYAEKGARVEWTLQQRKVGAYEPQEVAQQVVAPSGKETSIESFPGDLAPRTFGYDAEETGWHFIEVEFGASAVELKSDYLIETCARPSLDAFSTQGTFSIYVPKGSKDFGIRLVGSPSERVTATISDPDGAEVAKLENVSALGTWSVDADADGNPVPPKPGFWTIKLERPTVGILEDYIVTILGVPALIR